LAREQVSAALELESKMMAQDRLFIETLEKKNNVESYVYNMRNKLGSDFMEFTTESERERFTNLLNAAEEWLYNDGENETKSVYVSKLESLEALGNPIVHRKREFEMRPEVAAGLEQTILHFLEFANSADPKWDHIERAEKDQVKERCEAAANWLKNELTKQATVPKYSEPVFLCADIIRKKTILEQFCAPISEKPKPKPKVEEKKEEDKKDAEPQPKSEEKQEAKPAEKPTEMELD